MATHPRRTRTRPQCGWRGPGGHSLGVGEGQGRTEKEEEGEEERLVRNGDRRQRKVMERHGRNGETGPGKGDRDREAQNRTWWPSPPVPPRGSLPPPHPQAWSSHTAAPGRLTAMVLVRTITTVQVPVTLWVGLLHTAPVLTLEGECPTGHSWDGGDQAGHQRWVSEPQGSLPK